MKRWLALLTALLMLTSAALAEDDPVCVRVNDVSYPLSEVQASLSAQFMASEDTSALTDEEREAAKRVVMQSFVTTAVVHDKYLQYGLDQLSEADRKQMEALCEEAYANIVADTTAQVVEQYGFSEEAARPVAVELLNGYGYTRERVLEASRSTLEIDRLMTYLGITGDAADMDAYYESQCVQPSREMFESDASSYDALLQSAEQVVYYMPPECRRVQCIQLAYSEETVKELASLSEQLTAKGEEADAKMEAVNALTADEQSVELQEEYNALCDEYAQLSAKLEERRAAGVSELRPTLDEIAKRYAAGEHFDALVDEYSLSDAMPEGGYVVRVGSQLWPEAFYNAAMSLKAVGDLSAGIAMSDGAYLLCYAAELAEGAMEPDAETEAILKQYAIADTRDEQLQVYLASWLTEYDIVMDGSGLVIP